MAAATGAAAPTTTVDATATMKRDYHHHHHYYFLLLLYATALAVGEPEGCVTTTIGIMLARSVGRLLLILRCRRRL
ncbi:hypothetical protein BO71DRAFT_397249 [Aspergillus ellipticus CBS 707.79]|uniref:Uncharacterized protein n=1 Tax=Aspergillus ellipticus CBS 707.79 TaxID=1448320 RepID=A0A319E6J5_9EURO|nr:hypothetical protein BO71DRAFT_397249 [Aspergillus ellipticus CBS 707.79]